jgi:DNA-binding transcriptional ArsR family regulator
VTMADIELARYARQRGDILRTLKEDYLYEMTSVHSLIRALDAQGVSLAMDGLEFHLIYLADSGYVRVWRVKELPGFRRDRSPHERPDAIAFAKLLPKGLRLIDGLVPEDPAVSF